jgi:hypothetical protein
LLDSKSRPDHWKRSFKPQDYDLERVGWIYAEEASGGSIDIYEWVETRLLPSVWSALADTNEGTVA